MHRLTRSVAATLVLMLLAAGTAQARAFNTPKPQGLFAAAWQWASSLLGLPGFLEKEGGMMDPNGAPRNGLTTSGVSDAGGTMDPDGLHASPSDAGGMMDPNG
ncbi:MAG: hypothetical protein ACJ75H_06450 [Thermoanaerobaculia bacterium]